MKKLHIRIILILGLTQTTFAQQKLGVFDNHGDIGSWSPDSKPIAFVRNSKL